MPRGRPRREPNHRVVHAIVTQPEEDGFHELTDDVTYCPRPPYTVPGDGILGKVPQPCQE